MSGFLHQLASRSLGLAPQIKSRAALPYAAPATDFSMTETASHETPRPPSSARDLSRRTILRRNEQAMDNALPAPIVAENPAPATHVEMKTSTPAPASRPAFPLRQLPDNAKLETTHSRQPRHRPSSPARSRPNRNPFRDTSTRRQKPAAPPKTTSRRSADIESLVTRLLGDNKNHPEKSPESAAPPTVITAHQASQRPAEISTIRPQSTRNARARAGNRQRARSAHHHRPPRSQSAQPPGARCPAATPARPGAAVAVRLPGPPQRRPLMSNALAIAGVTAVIKDLLDSGMIDQAITDTLGAGVIVTSMAPDTVSLDNTDSPQLNLFLHQVTPNVAWRNAALPSRDAAGNRISNPPLALDLHYLLTAYGRAELQAEVLLGYALQLLHETPVLPRDAIRRALNPTVSTAPSCPPSTKACAAPTSPSRSNCSRSPRRARHRRNVPPVVGTPGALPADRRLSGLGGADRIAQDRAQPAARAQSRRNRSGLEARPRRTRLQRPDPAAADAGSGRSGRSPAGCRPRRRSHARRAPSRRRRSPVT
jgi:hypothetical protein